MYSLLGIDAVMHFDVYVCSFIHIKYLSRVSNLLLSHPLKFRLD